MAHDITLTENKITQLIAELAKSEEASYCQEFFNSLRNAKGKLTKGNIDKRIKVIQGAGESDELDALTGYINSYDSLVTAKRDFKKLYKQRSKFLVSIVQSAPEDETVASLIIAYRYRKLSEDESSTNTQIKVALCALHLALIEHYPKISLDDVKQLVVDDKWLTNLKANIRAEIERITHQLANRVKQLEERYGQPLPELTQTVESLSDKVAGHLKAMGLEWAQ